MKITRQQIRAGKTIENYSREMPNAAYAREVFIQQVAHWKASGELVRESTLSVEVQAQDTRVIITLTS